MAEEEGALSKLKNSVMGVLIGLVMIPASFVVVYLASQREQASEELVGAYTVEQAAKAQQEDKAVYITGKIKAPLLGEPGVIKPGPYLSLSKSRQMYGYHDVEKTRGSGENKETYYECEVDWLSEGDVSKTGKKCAKEGKTNPAFAIPEYSGSVKASIESGGTTYNYDTGSKTEASIIDIEKQKTFHGMPSANITEAEMLGAYPMKDGKFYENDGCASSPAIGCERFSYSGTAYDPAGDYTIIGTVEGNTVKAFRGMFLKIGPGSYDDVMALLESADTTGTWIYFGLAVIFLGGGLSLLVGPLLTLIEFIPLIGDFGAGLIRFIFFVFAFFTMGITFLLIEYWYLVLIFFVLVAVAILFIAKSRKSKSA
ncbi:MAG: hypothetical protein CMN76_04275 [Spirochaetaceae bacterium]|nr:hypothetical protein [Spirochaetaceae bacterium]|tara:strand:- start:324935 stop:326041 length:1107 start_codon:yes stop_codon:yes gene_type:complete